MWSWPARLCILATSTPARASQAKRSSLAWTKLPIALDRRRKRLARTRKERERLAARTVAGQPHHDRGHVERRLESPRPWLDLGTFLALVALVYGAIVALLGYAALEKHWLDCSREPGGVVTCVMHRRFLGIESETPPAPVRSVEVRRARTSMARGGGCWYDAVWVSAGTADERKVYGSCLDGDGQVVAAKLQGLLDAPDGVRPLRVPVEDSPLSLLCFLVALGPVAWIGWMMATRRIVGHAQKPRPRALPYR